MLNEKEFYTTDELSRLLKCEPRLIGKLRKYGLLSYIKIGKNFIHRKSDIDKFWEQYSGYDLSNEAKMVNALQMVTGKKVTL